jgi:hypothetical protein
VGSFEIQKSSLNPNNRIFENPRSNAFLDVRSELKWLGEKSKVIIRPRWTGLSQTVEYSGLTNPDKVSAKGKIDLTDFYGEISSEKLQITAGLFVDGWGPAEFVNPSNPIFRLNMQNKSFFFKEKGHVLTKLVYTPTDRATVVMLVEPVSNNEMSLREGEKFKANGLLRAEWQSADAAKLAGLVLGREPLGKDFVGQYLQLRSDSTGFSVYIEGRQTKDPERFEAISNGVYSQVQLVQREGYKNYSVLGLRWEGRADARLEWINYEQGYSESEWNDLLLSVTQISPAVLENANKFKNLGLELLSKNWLSASLRVPDIGPWSDWQWTNRLLYSMGNSTSGSMRGGLFQMDLEAPAFQSATFFLEAQSYFGQDNTELLLGNKNAFYAGGRWAW